MAWTFIRNVDLIEVQSVNSKRVWEGRAEFTDGQETRCITALFYDTSPNAARRTAARDKILDQLNTPPTPRELLEEYGEELRNRINRALANGKTSTQILTAIRNKLDELLD